MGEDEDEKGEGGNGGEGTLAVDTAWRAETGILGVIAAGGP